MTHDNVIQFSDLVKEKLGGRLLATVDSGHDELGNPIITGDLGPVEVSVYTSQDDGAIVVQIDSPTLDTSEHPTLRVYLNDTTLYDTHSDEKSSADNQVGDETK